MYRDPFKKATQLFTPRSPICLPLPKLPLCFRGASFSRPDTIHLVSLLVSTSTRALQLSDSVPMLLDMSAKRTFQLIVPNKAKQIMSCRCRFLVCLRGTRIRSMVDLRRSWPQSQFWSLAVVRSWPGRSLVVNEQSFLQTITPLLFPCTLLDLLPILIYSLVIAC